MKISNKVLYFVIFTDIYICIMVKSKKILNLNISQNGYGVQDKHAIGYCNLLAKELCKEQKV